METLLLPISPAKKQAITPPVWLAATGTYTCFVFLLLQISRFRWEISRVKPTGEVQSCEAKVILTIVERGVGSGRKEGEASRSFSGFPVSF